MSQVVVFPVNVTEKSIIIEIDDDDIAEDTETFSVVLGDPSNVVIDESRNHTKIWISDTEDCELTTSYTGHLDLLTQTHTHAHTHTQTH